MNYNYLTWLAVAAIAICMSSCGNTTSSNQEGTDSTASSVMTKTGDSPFLTLDLAMYNLRGQVKHTTTHKTATDEDFNPIENDEEMREDTLDFTSDGKLVKYRIRLDDNRYKHFARRNGLGQIVHYCSDMEVDQKDYNEWLVLGEDFLGYDELGRLVYRTTEAFDTGTIERYSYDDQGDLHFYSFENDRAEEAEFWVVYEVTKKDDKGNWTERKATKRGYSYEDSDELTTVETYYLETRDIQYY